MDEQGQVMVHGIWVFSDPSNTGRRTAEITVQVMSDCAGMAEVTRKAAAVSNGDEEELVDRGRTAVRSADLQHHSSYGDEQLPIQSPSQSDPPGSLTDLFWKALLQYRGRGA